MSERKPGRVTMTKQHALTLRGVLLWLEQQDAPDPLECDVLTAIVERVEHVASAGAIVRIRVKNLGTPPSEQRRQWTRDSIVKARAKKLGYAAPAWTPEGDAHLRQLWEETDLPSEEVAERLGRTLGGIRERVLLLGLRRSSRSDVRVHPRITPLGRARQVIARRRAVAAMAQRREEEIGDD